MQLTSDFHDIVVVKVVFSTSKISCQDFTALSCGGRLCRAVPGGGYVSENGNPHGSQGSS